MKRTRTKILSPKEGAVKAAAHRLRQKFREALRAAIAETVSTEEEIDDEIRHLFEVFGNS